MSILYLCEKPSQARDIARHLKATQRKTGFSEGNGYQITWALGHLLALAPPEYYKPDIKPWHIEKLPLIPEKWMLYITPHTKKQFYVIAQLLKNTSHVVIATDADREGEIIAREILAYCEYQGTIERLWLSALDDKSIQKALNQLKPGHETQSLYQAGLARQRADWLAGLNLTMAASSLYGVNSVLSIGRVQTPTLKLVVDRDEAIENFNPQDYFLLRGQFSNAQTQADSPNATQMFWATWQPSNQVAKRFFDENGHCLDRKLIESIAAKLEDEPAQVISCEEIKKTQKSPLCFSLSALQKQASSQWGYSAKRVLELAQRLYETHKAITYPRTDCGYLPIEQFDEAPQLLSTLANIDPAIKALVDVCEPQVKSSVWNDQKVTAHHAMIPTLNDKVMLDKMTPEERHIYDLIRDQYLAQFLGDYEYQQRRIELLCAGETFTVTGNTPLKLGWKQILETNSREETNTENPPENLEALPKFVKGQRVINQAITIECKQTKPKPRFSDGTLIEAMKNVGSSVQEKTLKDILKNSHGMGTEATRANIIETLCKRGYLIRQKKHLLSTQKGRALIALVPDKLKNPRLTAQWEQKLHQIAQGNGDVDAFLQAQAHELTGMLEELQSKSTTQKAATLQLQSETQNNKVYLCPKCQAPLRRLKNKKGKYFWGCIKYPNCDFTTWEKHRKPSL